MTFSDMSNDIQEKHINDLPTEVLVKIFSYLTLHQYLDIKDVCRQWNVITNCSYSWKHHPVIFDGDVDSFDVIYDIARNHQNNIKYIIFKRCKCIYIRKVLEYCKNLSSLEIIMSQVDDGLLSVISQFTNLRKLSFQNSYTATPDRQMSSAMHFHHMRKLERLFLSNFALNTDNFNSLFCCKNISFLMIEKIRNLPEDLIISFVEQNKDILKGLALYGDTCSDVAIEQISSCKRLTHLRMIRCDNLTDKSLNYLKYLNLQKLLLWNSDRFSTSALSNLFNHPSTKELTYLSFSKISNITLDIVKEISRNCLNLAFIAFYRCNKLQGRENDVILNVNDNTRVFFE